MFNAVLLFFVIHTTQVGVGIQGFQRIVYQDAKHDAWISVILAGVSSHIVAFFMIKTLEMYGTNDLYGIHQDVFGKWFGNFLNCLYIFYCTAAFFAVLKNYIEVIQTWVFQNVNTWILTVTLLLLIIYAVTGGLRVIVGLSFFSFIFSLWLFPMLIYPLQFTGTSSLFPILESNMVGILKGVQSMTFTIIGFELLNILYPFVKEKEKVKKNVHLGLLMTTITYLLFMLVSLTYFSEGQLNKTIWATLSLFNIIKFPFIERFEYLAICFWMLLILPNLCLYLWAAYRGIKRMVNISLNKVVWIIAFLTLFASIVIQTRTEINKFNDYFAHVAFYTVFVYPIFLYVIAIVKKKFTSKKEQA